MLNEPIPDIEGSKTPLDETPVPENVPPTFNGVNCTGGSVLQKGPAGLT